MEPILPHQPPYICCRCRSKKRTIYKNAELIREESSQLLTSSIFLAGKKFMENKKNNFWCSLFRPTRMETSCCWHSRMFISTYGNIYQNWPKKHHRDILLKSHNQGGKSPSCSAAGPGIEPLFPQTEKVSHWANCFQRYTQLRPGQLVFSAFLDLNCNCNAICPHWLASSG